MQVGWPIQVRKRKHNHNKMHTSNIVSKPEYPALVGGGQHTLKECMRVFERLLTCLGEDDTFEIGEFRVA